MNDEDKLSNAKGTAFSLPKRLFEKREPRLSGIYGLAGIVLLLVGLAGFQYGAALIYWPLALICFSMIFYPTLFCWGFMAGSFGIAALMYIGFTFIELLTKGEASTIYSDGLLVYLIYVAVIVAVAIGLLLAKPEKIHRQET